MTFPLAPKFTPFLLNQMNDREMKDLRERLSAYLDNKAPPEQIMFPESCPEWVLKGPSKDLIIDHFPHPSSYDQHIYRLRKAKKINEVIQKNQFSCFFVPCKYLLEHRGNYYVVSKKIIGTPLKDMNDLTSKEKRELVTIIFKANFFNLVMKDYVRTSDGRIAIVDTQPFARGVFKTLKVEWYQGGVLSQPFFKNWLKSSLGCSTALRVAKNEPTLLDQIKPILWLKVAVFAATAIFVIAAGLIPREKNLLFFVSALIPAVCLAAPFYPILEYDITMLITAYIPSLIGVL